MISIRGGSGKSVLSVNFASDLSLLGYKVLLVEADFLAPNLIYSFPEMSTNYFWNDFVLDKTSQLDKLIYTSNLPFDVIPTKPNDDEILTNLQDPAEWKRISQKISTFIRQLRERYDFLIFDNQSGRFLSTITHAFFSDYLICIIRPDHSSFKATIDYLKLFKSNFFIIWNQILHDKRINTLLNQWQDQIKDIPNFKQDLGYLHFNEAAAYEMWFEKTVIPTDDSFRTEIKDLVTKFIENYE